MHWNLLSVMIWVGLSGLAGCTCSDPQPPRKRIDKPLQPLDEARMKKVREALGDKLRRAPSARVELAMLVNTRLGSGDDPWVFVQRDVPAEQPVRGALTQLFVGPDEAQLARGLVVHASGFTGFEDLQVDGGVASLTLRGSCAPEPTGPTVADHIERTLTRLPDIDQVRVSGPDGDAVQPDGSPHARPRCLVR